MVSKWLERKIEDLILGLVPIPYADREIVEIAESVLGVEGIPGLPPLHLGDLSTGQKILLLVFGALPILDLEYLDLVGLDPFKNAEGGLRNSSPKLDSAAFDRTKKMGDGSGRLVTDGGRPGGGGGGSKAAGVVKGFLKTALKFSPVILIILGLFMATGFLGGSGYGALIGNQLGLQFVGLDLEEEIGAVQQGIQTMKCFGNAACMRQWRANNTKQPGSEETGESYKLQIESKTINSGYPIDIANRKIDYPLSMGFSLYNPRHGLKGIPARGVEYRIRIEDLNHQGENAYCSTRWRKVDDTFASQELGKTPGTLLPGSFVTISPSGDELNIRKCNLLQPGLGISRRASLEIRYNYSSQATLYFDAMSWSKMEDQGIRQNFKKSRTADTPVKTFVNVEAPAFYRMSDGQRVADIFRLRMGLETGEDIKYKVNPRAMRLYDSQQTVRASQANGPKIGQALSCDLEKIRPNTFKMDDEFTEYLKRVQKNQWFTEQNGPPAATCSMVLENPQEISRSGETLTMRVYTNYTVKLEESMGSFTVENSLCSSAELNCPLLVPFNKNPPKGEKTTFLSTCDPERHPDAANGCEVREYDTPEDLANTGPITTTNTVDKQIETGETAYLLDNLGLPTKGPGVWYQDGGGKAIGLSKDMAQDLENGVRGVALIKYQRGSGQNTVQDVDAYSNRQGSSDLCKNDYTVKQYKKQTKQLLKGRSYISGDIKVLWLRTGITNKCGGPSYTSVKSNCNGVVMRTYIGKYACFDG